MPPTAHGSNRVVYVVMGWPRSMTNDRVAKLLQLRPHFQRMVLVTRDSGPSDEEHLAVRGVVNPVAWLRALGLHRLRYHLERHLFFPNSHVLFTAVAKRRLAQAVRNDLQHGREVVVLTCVPNHENTAVGLYLKKAFPALRWVVDWQDLWTYDDNYFGRVPVLYRRLVRARERRVLAVADMHVTTNRRAQALLRDHFGVPDERVLAIHHHFDRSEMCKVPEPRGPREFGPITIGFLGSLFKPPRVPGLKLVEALRSLRRAGLDVELHLHGGLPPELKAKRRWLEESGVVLRQPVSHAASAATLAQYDYVLVLLEDLANSRVVMSIKLPQYLLTGRPILALVPEDSAVADIVTRTRTGIVVPAAGEWAHELGRVLCRRETRSLGAVDYARLEEYAWSSLSRRWLDVLQAPVAGPVSSPPPAAGAAPRAVADAGP